MSESITPAVAAPKRLLRPLPSAGASRRVRKQPVDTGIQSTPVSQPDDDTPTPKASTTPLPPEAPDVAFTFSVPILKVNDAPPKEIPTTSLTDPIDEAKDAELRKKFLGLRIQEPVKPIAPVLKIPKKAKAPVAPVERPLAKVKDIDTAPKPQIVFGDTTTVFGESKDATPEKDAEPPEVNPTSHFRAQQRRMERERRERLGLARDKSRLEPLPPPDPSIPLDERRKTRLPSIGAEEEDGSEGEKRKEAKQKIKRLAALMAKDLEMKRIPKSQLRAMAQGKTPEETAARTKILELALKIAAKSQEKAQEQSTVKKDEKSVAATPDPGASEGNPTSGGSNVRGVSKDEKDEIKKPDV